MESVVIEENRVHFVSMTLKFNFIRRRCKTGFNFIYEIFFLYCIGIQQRRETTNNKLYWVLINKSVAVSIFY